MSNISISQLYEHFHLIPIGQNKQPNFKILKGEGWKQFRDKKIELNLLKNTKVGVVCGPDNLEVIDIDNHFDDAEYLFEFISTNFDLDKFPVIGTPGGGFHIYYRCDAGIDGNQKLAQRKNKKYKYEALIETRGDGGYVVFYNNIISGDIYSVPQISKEDRNTLLSVCKALDEKIEDTEKEKESKTQIEDTKLKPGEIYNDDPTSIQETKSILRNIGWKEVGKGYWRRPDKKNGVSATFGRVGKNKFYVFSSNADPFEPETSYSMFAVKTIIEFGGNYSDCAKALAERYNIKTDYNKKEKKKTNKANKKNDSNRLNDKWQALFDTIEEWDLKIRYNQLTRVLDYKYNGGEWLQDIDVLFSDLVFELENNKGIKSISKNKVHEMIMTRNIVTLYNPIESFIKSIPKWDKKTDYIKQLTDYITLADSESRDFFYNMIKKHLIRTIATAMNDDYTNRMVVVLHGKQEIGKTKLWEWLTPKELYYDEPLILADKDSFIALSRYLFINMDDLDQLNKKEVSKLKAYVSKGATTKRLPYARTEMRLSRVASIVGTTNLMDILADQSNTRWIILKVKNFDWKKYTKEIDPMNIWAQAKQMHLDDYESGELTKEEKNTRDLRNNQEFLETSSEREILIKYFKENHNMPALTATDIKNIIERNLAPQRINFYQLNRELKRIYGEPKNTRYNQKSGKYYFLQYKFDLNPYDANVESVFDAKYEGEDIPF